MTAWNAVVSLTLAAVTTAVRGSPPPSQTKCSLDPGLPRSAGFCVHVVPPRLARMLAESTLTRSQSTWPCSPRRSKTRRCRASNTPAVAYSVSRRQQVAGEPQPNSRAGSSRHGVEVRAM